MKTIQAVLLITLFFSLMACESNEKSASKVEKTTTETTTTTPKTVDKATTVLQETIKAHGGELYDQAKYQFTFRGKNYRFKNDGAKYMYSSYGFKGGVSTKDELKNGVFSRKVNDTLITLPEKKKTSAIGALNSVIYFATLPHKLNDAAVNVSYVEETTIKSQLYDVLKVTFNQDGGGEDFEDEYHYWIHQNTKKIDYLAYNYQVNDGGVRFRSAYNVRVVDGITFQDYINYKAEVGTPLKELPALYEQGSLKELSRIETQNIINLKQ